MTFPASHIHILGASGSGTTTLAQALAGRLGYVHLDTDRFYWLPTDPPFQEPRPVQQRLSLLYDVFGRHQRWVLSGSLVGWGDPLIALFDLVVFLALPASVRMQRLLERERMRYGAGRIQAGGDLHDDHTRFMAWARNYDVGDGSSRSRVLHERWMAALPCRVIRLEGDLSVEERMARVLDVLPGDPQAKATGMVPEAIPHSR